MTIMSAVLKRVFAPGDAMPDAVKAKLAHLEDRAEEARGAVRAAHERLRDAADGRRDCALQTREARATVERLWKHRPGPDADAARADVRRLEERLAAAEAGVARITPRAQELNERA